MNRRTLMIGAVGVLSVVGTFLYALMQKGGPQKIAERRKEMVREVGKVTEPMTSSIRNFNPVTTAPPKSKTIPKPSSLRQVRETGDTLNAPTATSISIFAAEPQGEKPVPRGPKGDYAPAFRLVKCQLVNTVDSSNVTTPIIGLVTEDLCWNGKIIIRANSEVHGVASVDRVRERIASEGEFTFVLNESDRRGRELVTKGLVLNMERDPEYDTYGITDGSAGLRGDVIRTANNDVIKLYAASLISGISGAVSSGSSGILGNRVYTNNSSLGLSALQGGVINPIAGGTQGALDRYADQISKSIERDGFFVRVPAGKQFYVYCSEAIDLSQAKIGADDERDARAQADLEKKARDQVRRALPVDAANLLNPLLPTLNSINQSKN
ncbi:MAG TPA: TrbI/VirB10 family protein [Chthoniobacterales bacterium]|nr:TrbI/VirB10 family protein [Chthoniobacterales bacterium]